ncbi:MAG: 2-succinyl-5-enolpyruvyl-6-hydroxy-3-cyclohexene-1-carboxylic-acid synthase [Cephaloticoccus sp.]|nr:2-succinyl-5-enolpyruvyl-6-hydroxy-3-cyclohexene-1-carboxylic-acid synthase [Cephaloticoccus sp.]MCF7759952.1 2-succinyl-5-enolpyruvyl-6-hydroxy-3-cyclohexene-1-carboxylic-acid synthase [Cephaloticoccus sp.]
MISVPLDYRNVNTLWGSVLAETLVRCGITRAVISPGSRSTPLTMALTRHPEFESIPVLDERSAAFFALGLARQNYQPVVLVCTSGSAGANYYPAVIEAQESGVPLLIITADRPPELRACASGQTIDQQQLYGTHVNHFHELALPDAAPRMLDYLRQTLAHSCDRTLQPQAGPVHLNVPFRDPLAPMEDPAIVAMQDQLPENFFDHLAAAQSPVWGASKLWMRAISGLGLIVAGPECPPDPAGYAKTVGQLATRLGWPILADGVSPLRYFPAGNAVVVSAYDTILRNAAQAHDLVPRHVICLGSWPTSKVLRHWLEQGGAEIVLVSTRIDNRDAMHGRTRQICASIETVEVKVKDKAPDSYARRWQSAEVGARTALQGARRPAQPIFEGDIAGTLAVALPEDTPCFVASSMPIRDVEYFWPPTSRRHRMFFNRGANGIDGTLSTAVGIAHGNRPAVLLTGDLAFLHDSNGLLLLGKLLGSLTVVLINNAGGGIFEHLPVAQFDPPFEEYFATPQAVDFAQLCQAHGVKHIRVKTLAQLGKLTAKLPVSGIRVLEVRTNRELDAALRKRLFTQAAATL